MTMLLPGSSGVIRFTDNLKQFNLNFENVIIHSRLREFEKEVPDSGLSIKVGWKGEENYYFRDGVRTVSNGKYLVVNRHQEFSCHLKSREPVEAFCLYLGQEVMEAAWNKLTKTEEALLDNPEKGYFVEPQFLEKIYTLEENELGQYLAQLIPRLQTNFYQKEIDYNQIYLTMAEKLILSQEKINEQINRISATRQSTREELYRRLSLAHRYILNHFTSDIQLDQLAREAMLSKYHLLRAYKEVYGLTPYRHVLHLRLEKAKSMLKKNYSMEEIACALGFCDRRSFTKTFRKMFAVAPSAYREEVL
ncbi:MAG: AraC family transcriptional regulator [Saprospiraceae bacterium]|nr:MAG: AraC family transcriptional regulator [Saprospiraceae bacterium]